MSCSLNCFCLNLEKAVAAFSESNEYKTTTVYKASNDDFYYIEKYHDSMGSHYSGYLEHPGDFHVMNSIEGYIDWVIDNSNLSEKDFK